MDSERDVREKELARLSSERDKVFEQIRKSQETIERSQRLLKQIDEMLAKSLLKP